MKAIVIRPFRQPVVEEIGSGYRALRKIVGGGIEAIYPWEDEVALVCNDEGKINGLPLNRPLFNVEGQIVDIIAGTFFICGRPADSEDFASIPDELIDKYIRMFQF